MSDGRDDEGPEGEVGPDGEPEVDGSEPVDDEVVDDEVGADDAPVVPDEDAADEDADAGDASGDDVVDDADEEVVAPAPVKGGAPSRPSTRKPAERPGPGPKAKDTAKGPRGSKGSRRARRRRVGVEEAAAVVLLLAFVAQVVNLSISDAKASTGAWFLLAALGAAFLFAVSRVADKRGRLTPLRGRGLGALALVLALAAFSLTTVIVNEAAPQLGIDLRGGFSVTLTAEGNPPSDSVDQAVDIIRNRIDGLGVAEPEVTRQGDAVVVNLPGVQDRERALEIVGETAKLEFRPVLAATAGIYDGDAAEAGDDPCAVVDPSADPTAVPTTVPADGSTTVPADGATAVPTDGATTTAPAATTAPADAPTTTAAPKLRQQESTTTTTGETTTTVAGETTTTVAGETTTTVAGETTVPEDPTATTVPTDDGSTAPPAGPSDTETIPNRPVADEPPIYCSTVGPIGFEGDALSKAQAELGGQTGSEWVVAVRVKGSQQSTANTLINACFQAEASCPTQQMAIVLDGEVISSPTVQNLNLADDEFVINGGGDGGFPEADAKDLALKLRYGALPVEFRSSDEQQLSPSLGDDTLRAGILAGLIGLIAVALYLIVYYRALGVVVVLGLGVWSALMYGVVCWLSATRGLTLSISGVVGIVVSLGTTVDSYVVHFERLKDEVRLGKTVRASAEKGFQKAFRTILTADLASLMGAVLLWYLTVGAVRGFAFFLGLSVVLDLFVAYCFDRPMVALLARSDFFVRNPIFGVARGLGRSSDDAPGRVTSGASS